jgi:uncharacterized membrane protein YfcA
MDWSATELFLAFVTMTVASAVQGSVGFGLNLIAAPILALIDPAFVPGPALAAGLFQTIIMATRERASIVFKDIGWAVIGRVVGTSCAIVVLSLASRSEANIVFGSLVLLGVGLSLLGLRLKPVPRVLIAAGWLAGLMNTISSIGGPPMALVYQHVRGPSLRGTLAGHFCIGASISLAALILAGHYIWSDVIATAVLVPGVLLGFAGAGPLSRLIDSRSARPAILALSGLAGTAVILRELF